MMRRLLVATAIAACLAMAAPAKADDPGMGTPTAVEVVFTPPEPFTPSETLSLDPAPAPVNTITMTGVVTYRGHTRRAITRDGVVYLARTGRKVGPRTAATFQVR